jgi:hypothetical protein
MVSFRRGRLVYVSALVSLALAAPAQAADTGLLDALSLDLDRMVAFDVQTERDAGKSVTGVCVSVIGVADFESTEFVVQAKADATTEGAAAAPVGTTVSCALKDRDNLSVTFGTLAGGLPGPVAVTVPKTIKVPAGKRVRTCVTAWAGYTDGDVVTQAPAC